MDDYPESPLLADEVLDYVDYLNGKMGFRKMEPLLQEGETYYVVMTATGARPGNNIVRRYYEVDPLEIIGSRTGPCLTPSEGFNNIEMFEQKYIDKIVNALTSLGLHCFVVKKTEINDSRGFMGSVPMDPPINEHRYDLIYTNDPKRLKARRFFENLFLMKTDDTGAFSGLERSLERCGIKHRKFVTRLHGDKRTLMEAEYDKHVCSRPTERFREGVLPVHPYRRGSDVINLGDYFSGGWLGYNECCSWDYTIRFENTHEMSFYEREQLVNFWGKGSERDKWGFDVSKYLPFACLRCSPECIESAVEKARAIKRVDDNYKQILESLRGHNKPPKEFSLARI